MHIYTKAYPIYHIQGGVSLSLYIYIYEGGPHLTPCLLRMACAMTSTQGI